MNAYYTYYIIVDCMHIINMTGKVKELHPFIRFTFFAFSLKLTSVNFL